MRFLTAAFMLAFAAPALAEISDIPSEESAFLEVIGSVHPDKRDELLGEPDETIILRNQENGEEMGVIVHYRYINTNSEGEYYKTTELDYLNGRLVMIVFSNSDFLEAKTAARPQDDECTAIC